MNSRKFVRDVGEGSGGDCLTAFRLLGVVVFISQVGVEPVLSGRLVSMRTFFQWAEVLRLAGWGEFLTDPGYQAGIREMLKSRLGGEGARPPQAVGRRGSDAVKGLGAAREAKPSALDRVASGGSLGEAAAEPGNVEGEWQWNGAGRETGRATARGSPAEPGSAQGCGQEVHPRPVIRGCNVQRGLE